MSSPLTVIWRTLPYDFWKGWQVLGIYHFSREDGRMVEHVRYPGATTSLGLSATPQRFLFLSGRAIEMRRIFRKEF